MVRKRSNNGDESGRCHVGGFEDGGRGHGPRNVSGV